MSLTPEQVRTRWTTRLRNPGAIQARGKLRKKDGGRCCLGVLCDMAQDAGLGHWKSASYGGDEVDVFVVYTEEGYPIEGDGIPPTPVLVWAGLTLDAASGLAEMNDGVGGAEPHTFPQIANVIDRLVVV